ncbi:MAG: RNA ligase family protein [Myxococcaceae bacterium]
MLARPVRVLEKLDGLNVGLCFDRGRLRLVSRAHGLLAPERLGGSLARLGVWAVRRFPELWSLLGHRRVAWGEWLGTAMNAQYRALPDWLVFFDLCERGGRDMMEPGRARAILRRAGFATAEVLFEGRVPTVAALARLVPTAREGWVLEQGRARFKVVRTGHRFMRAQGPNAIAHHPRPVAALVAAEPSPRIRRSAGRVLKTYAKEHAAPARVEATALRALRGSGLAPRLLAHDPLRLELEPVGGETWGRRRPIADLGRTLAALHRRRPPSSLPQGPVRLRDLGRNAHLEALDADLGSEPPAFCHGDMKPSNLCVNARGLTLLDFEQACRAAPSWELASASLWLGLSDGEEDALLDAYRATTRVRLRVALFRHALTLFAPRELRARLAGRGRPPSAFARAAVARLEDGSRRLLDQLTPRR